MICPTCKGQKSSVCHLYYGPGKGGEWKRLPCSRCSGEGTVPDEQAAWVEEGKKLLAARVCSGDYRNLDTEAARLGIDAVTLSKMEQGSVKPYSLP